MRVKELFAFILERYAVYERRKAGEPKPWTKNPILQQYRFCNVYRELDKVTVWIRDQWREPNVNQEDVWFAMVVARLINLPAALECGGYPVPWNPRSWCSALRKRKLSGEKVFSAAYMIHAANDDHGLKTDYLAKQVLAPLWKDRADVRPRKGDTLRQFHERLMTYHDIGSFIGGQVVADTKFTGSLRKAEDWWTFVAPGPGSERGLNRVCGFPVKDRWEPETFRRFVNELQTKLDPLLREAGMERLSGQDTNNVLCEYDKYERARLGEGRPKQRYPGV